MPLLSERALYLHIDRLEVFHARHVPVLAELDRVIAVLAEMGELPPEHLTLDKALRWQDARDVLKERERVLNEREAAMVAEARSLMETQAELLLRRNNDRPLNREKFIRLAKNPFYRPDQVRRMLTSCSQPHN